MDKTILVSGAGIWRATFASIGFFSDGSQELGGRCFVVLAVTTLSVITAWSSVHGGSRNTSELS